MSNPILEMITAFKSIHVLNDVQRGKDANGRPILKATHYCVVLINGRDPVWGVWTATGRFVRYCSSRSQIAELYPKKAWNRVMASWMLQDADANMKDVATRVRALEERYGGHIERNTDTDNRPKKENTVLVERGATH